jgi:alkylation response protein AidB-like acyl-CoA dehydrogenase
MPKRAEVNQKNPEQVSVLSNARALRDWLQGEAMRIEEERRIPQDVAERLAAAGLFRMTQPPRFGGLGYTPRQAWEVVFEIARGCSSCAWIVGLNAANVLLLGKFSGQLQQEIFLGGKPPIVSMLTGGVGNGVTAKLADGGVILSGRWRYASGVDIASWIGLLVSLPTQNGDSPEMHVALVPQESFSIDHSSWHVLGTRGTGSKDISLPPTFVPNYRWESWNHLQAGGKHPTCPNDEPVYEYPLNSVFAMSILAPTLGVASAVAEEFCSVIKTRVNGATQQRQSDDKIAQIDAAVGEATIAMLRQVLLEDSDLVLTIIDSGRQPTAEERAAIRMRIAVSSRIALAACQRMFSAMGGSLLPSDSRPERLFRDFNTMSSHMLLQPESIGEAYGRILLGMEVPPGARL